jgi:curved DNA-binding protein CbpA
MPNNSEPNYYKVLQVDPDAEHEVIEAAYRRLAKKYHPDVYKGSDREIKLRDINVAHDILKNPDTRTEYDLQRQREARQAKDALREEAERRARAAQSTTSPRYESYTPPKQSTSSQQTTRTGTGYQQKTTYERRPPKQETRTRERQGVQQPETKQASPKRRWLILLPLAFIVLAVSGILYYTKVVAYQNPEFVAKDFCSKVANYYASDGGYNNLSPVFRSRVSLADFTRMVTDRSIQNCDSTSVTMKQDNIAILSFSVYNPNSNDPNFSFTIDAILVQADGRWYIDSFDTTSCGGDNPDVCKKVMSFP